MIEREIHLKQLIAPVFQPVHQAIRQKSYSEFWLYGGRGSGKSSFVSLELILLLMRNPGISAVALRKVGLNLRDSVYEQLCWAIEVLGVGASWQRRLSPLELVYLPTGQRIIFRGCDNPEKLKSIRVKNGYIGAVWFEELTEFAGAEEIRNVQQSLLRGGEIALTFCTYNPPANPYHWVNRAAEQKLDGRLCVGSTYKNLPPEWLGNGFLQAASRLEQINPRAFGREYLGIVDGSTRVFPNLELRHLTDAECAAFDQRRYGLDWGYGPDPLAFVVCHLDKKRQLLYIFDEFYQYGVGFDQIAAAIKQKNPEQAVVCADSAEPRSNDELRMRGIRIRAAKKGPGSVEHGIVWLQSLNKIIIDERRAAKTAQEFAAYQFAEPADGKVRGAYPDKNNHAIDAVRYALEADMRQSTYSFV